MNTKMSGCLPAWLHSYFCFRYVDTDDGVLVGRQFRASAKDTRVPRKRIQLTTHHSLDGNVCVRAGERLSVCGSMPAPPINSTLLVEIQFWCSMCIADDRSSIHMQFFSFIRYRLRHFVLVGSFPFHNSSCSTHTHSLCLQSNGLAYVSRANWFPRLSFRWRKNPLDRRYQMLDKLQEYTHWRCTWNDEQHSLIPQSGSLSSIRHH